MPIATPEMRLNPCLGCGKGQADLAAPMKRCGRCKGASYCSKDCQVGDWPRHKSHCGAGMTAPNTTNNGGSVASRVSDKHVGSYLNAAPASGPPTIASSDTSRPRTSPSTTETAFQSTLEQVMAMFGQEEQRDRTGRRNLYLSKFASHTDAIHHLIDSFRLRAEDESLMDLRKLGMYNPTGLAGALRDFSDLLDLAERNRVLPDWWTADKRRQCADLAADPKGGYYVGYQDSYTDEEFVEGRYDREVAVTMQLRNLATDVYGCGVPRW